MKWPRTRSDLDSITEVHRLLDWARIFVRSVGAAFGLLIAYFQLNNISFQSLFTDVDPQTFVRFALVIYYNAWYFGSSFDTKMNEMILLVDPDKGKIPKSLFFILPFFVAAGIALFVFSDNPLYLARSLAFFFIVDIIMWFNYVRFMRPKLRANQELYKQRGLYLKLEQVNHFAKCYIAVWWQCARFGAMGVILAAMLFLTQSDEIRQLVSTYVHDHWINVAADSISATLPAFLFFAYVLLAESTSWAMRLRARSVLYVLNNLKDEYALYPITPRKNLGVEKAPTPGV